MSSGQEKMPRDVKRSRKQVRQRRSLRRFGQRLRYYLRSFALSLRHNTWQKVLILLIATGFWFFVQNDQTTTVQRSLSAPLKIEGLLPGDRVQGVPKRVWVQVSGPRRRVGALSAQSVQAIMKVTRGSKGGVERQVQVFPPQGIKVLDVNPSALYPRLVREVERQVGLEPHLMRASTTAYESVSLEPQMLSVRGPENVVARVASIIVNVDATTGQRVGRPYAVDEHGNPILAVQLLGAKDIRLTIQKFPIYQEKRLPLSLQETTGDVRMHVLDGSEQQRQITVVGKAADLNSLQRVRADIPDTTSLRVGLHILPLQLRLPPGIAAMETPSVSVLIQEP